MNESAVHSTSGFLPWIEFGDFRFQSYFVVVSLVLSLCAIWIPRRARNRRMSPRFALDIFIAAMLGGLIGSRLLHVLWEEPAYYAEDPWRIFDIMSGGFVWYGGALGGFIAVLILVKMKRDTIQKSKPTLAWLDFFSPIAAFGYAGGRMACLLTGCCFGAVCPWPPGTDSHAHDVLLYRFPTQGFAVVWELALGFFLLRFEAGHRKQGTVFFTWLLLHSIGRIIMEVFRADPRGLGYGPITLGIGLSLLFAIAAGAGLASRRRQ